MGLHIFISYARIDSRVLALKLQQDLTDQGYTVWLDTNEIGGGASWSLEIERAIDTSDYALALLSKGSFESEICRAEQMRALRKNKNIIPVMVHSGAERPLYLESLNYRDFSNNSSYPQNLQLLISDLEKIPVPLSQPIFTQTNADPLPPDYIERPALLDTMRNAVLNDNSDRRIALAALHGLGGIGKSVLASALCHDEVVQDAFPDGVIWLKIGQKPATLLPHMREVVRLLGGDTSQCTSETEAQSQLRLLLPTRSVLIVLDDVWDVNEVRPFIVEAPRCRVLFTTRDKGIAQHIAVKAVTITVGELSPSEGLELLRKSATINATELPAIAQELGYHALALSLAGGRISTGMSPKDWLTSYRTMRTRVVRLGRTANERDNNLEVCFNLSLNALSAEDQPLYHTLGIFPEDVWVPRSTVVALWRGFGITMLDAEELLDRIIQLALIDERSDDRALSLHDLLHDFNIAHIENPPLVHQKLIEGWGDAFQLPDPYAWQYHVYHLLIAEKQEDAQALLTNPVWLRAKLNYLHPSELLDDYAALHAVNGGDDLTRLLESAIRLSLNTLEKDQTQWPNQMRGRLTPLRNQTKVSQFLDQVMIEDKVLEPIDNKKAFLLPAGGWLLQVFDNRVEAIGGAVEFTEDKILAWPPFLLFEGSYVLTLWSITGTQLAVFEGHTDNINGVLIIPDGRILSWSDDHTLRLWNNQGSTLTVFKGHNGKVNGALWLSDRRILSWSDDYTLRLWDDQGVAIAILNGHQGEVNGVLLLSSGYFLSWSHDNTLRLWDMYGLPLALLEGHSDWVFGAIELSDGRLLSWSADSTLCLWNSDGTYIVTLRDHTYSVFGAIELNNHQILSWGEDYGLRLWDSAGILLETLDGHLDRVKGAIELADNRILSWSEDNTLRLWNSRGLPLDVLEGHSDNVSGALILSDGRLISWAGGFGFGSRDHSLRVWTNDGRPFAVFEGHTNGVMGALELKDRRLLSWSIDGTLRLWKSDNFNVDQASNADNAHRDSVYGLLALTNDQVLSWHGSDYSNDHNWGVWSKDGKLLRLLSKHTDSIRNILQLKSGNLLSWSRHQIQLWDINCEHIAELTLSSQKTDMWFDAWFVRGVLELKDGRLLAWIDNNLQLWQSDGIFLKILEGHSDKVLGVRELKDGRILSWSDDHTLRLWSREGILLNVLSNHTDSVTGALELTDGRILSWSNDRTLRLWDTTLNTVKLLEGHSDNAIQVMQLADGRLLSWARIIGAEDHTLFLWSTTGELITTITGHHGLADRPVEVADSQILIWSGDGALHLWNSKGIYLAKLERWMQDYPSRFIEWSTNHNINSSLFLKQRGDLIYGSNGYARIQNNIWIYNRATGVVNNRFIGDAAFTSLALSPDGTRLVAGDAAGRVLFFDLSRYK